MWQYLLYKESNLSFIGTKKIIYRMELDHLLNLKDLDA